MSTTFKQSAAVVASVLILVVAWYGNYLPLQKSQNFITATRNVENARTFDQFIATMSVPLDSGGPIGQEELVRNLTSVVLNVLRSPSGKDARLTDAILKYVHKYYDPILARGRGMSFEQDLYLMGLANQIAFTQTKNEVYYNAALSYFLYGNKLGPQRPQTLYGLFDLYRLTNNKAGMQAVGAQILQLWPNDPTVRQILNDLNKPAATSSKPVQKK
jgi:hypothetical protein